MNGHSWVGKTIAGRYQVEDLLGQGGMSAVYKAYDPNLRRKVAIKLIHPHLSTDPNFVGRFKEEAAAVARLRHPNIVQVHDFDIDGETYYMVMEFLAGETMQTRLKRLNAAHRFMSISEAIGLCTQLCDAVGYAHKHELVHRDIKPANIMLDVNGRAILMDFGIVKIIGGDYHTATGATIGTAKYMSPEQIRGERVDDRSDIYSLGVTFYEMIGGRPPYQADSAITLMMMVLNDPLPDLRDLRDGIPEELVEIIQKALAKEPSARFQTMEEMAAALQSVHKSLADESLAATVVDQDESESVKSPGLAAPDLAATVKDPLTGLEDAGASSLQIEPAGLVTQRPGEQAPAPDTVQDRPAEPESARIKRRPITRSVSPRMIGSVAGILLLVLVISAGLLVINARKPPYLQLKPISRPQIPINIQTAQFVVNLGVWETDSLIETLAYAPNSALLGTVHNRDALPFSPYRFYAAVWQVDSGNLQKYLLGHTQWMNDGDFTPDSLLFGAASDDAHLILWRVNDGSIERTIEAESGGFTSLDISPNNLLLAAGSWDGSIGLWQLKDGILLRTLQANDSSIWNVAFSPDGQLLAAALEDHTILLWRVSDGDLVHTLQGHAALVHKLAFSPDGALLASASEDYNIGLWGVGDGKLLRTLQGHSDYVYDVAFSQDGSLLASGSGDGTIRLWQVSDGQMMNILTGHEDSVTSVVFSPDSYLLVSGASDGIVQFWGISEAITPGIEPVQGSP